MLRQQMTPSDRELTASKWRGIPSCDAQVCQTTYWSCPRQQLCVQDRYQVSDDRLLLGLRSAPAGPASSDDADTRESHWFRARCAALRDQQRSTPKVHLDQKSVTASTKRNRLALPERLLRLHHRQCCHFVIQIFQYSYVLSCHKTTGSNFLRQSCGGVRQHTSNRCRCIRSRWHCLIRHYSWNWCI